MRILIATIVLLAVTSPALAQQSTIAEGRSLSEINCARCHSMELAGESPLTDAPPFRDIARNYSPEELTDGFMEGLAVRHPLMPDWEVTMPQAEALTAFIMSLGDQRQAKTEANPISIGFVLLREKCASCHAIDMASASALAKAPPFRDVVKRYDPSALEEALAEGIVTGHPNMPEFVFEPDQIAAIVAYLDSLKAQ